MVAVLGDYHPGTRFNPFEQLDHIGVAHANAAMRNRDPHGLAIRATVDVDIPPQGVTLTTTVAPGFRTRQPDDARRRPT